MILADENIPDAIIKSLREEGFEVVSVIESARSIKDEQVIQLALQYNYLLLTEDKDFGEWVFAHHVQDLSSPVESAAVKTAVFCHYNH